MSFGRLTFLGAAETVTGSRALLEREGARLLVDCGLFQGLKKLRQRNWADPGFDVASLNAVVLTHAHIDHSGYLPRLCRLGYGGPIYCTPGTRDLLELLLPDAAFLQEEEARHAEEWGYSKHRPAEPLFRREDAARALTQLEPIPFHRPFEPAPGIVARFTRAGHIIGSASISLGVGEKTLVFTGDVGRPADPIMRPPEPLPTADYLVIESTYGDRRHAGDPSEVLARAIVDTVERRGVIVVPAFAVGRAQHLVHLIASLRGAGKIPEVPVFLDSPMAIDATNLFFKHASDHRLSGDECRRMGALVRYARTSDESKAIDATTGPMIVISASGMATGGRVLHHLRRFLPDEKNLVLLVGYQAVGTRGRSLLQGADELKIQGQYVPVRAKIGKLEGLSAHADYLELIAWLRTSGIAPKRVFVTHGEPDAADALRRRLHDSFGWNPEVPELGALAELA